jgi:hypothetical protein
MQEQVFLLYHIRPTGQLLLVGAYSCEENAKAAIQRLKGKPGFAQYPDCFEYHAYDLNGDLCANGFSEDEEGDDSAEEVPPLLN